MTPTIAIIAALPREISVLVRDWQRHDVPRPVFLWSHGPAVVACAGMGPKRVTLAIEAALRVGTIRTIYSVGLAGACDPRLSPGAILQADTIIDLKSGERFGKIQGDTILASAGAPASVLEKARLRASYRASAVDMEAATVARLARIHGLECCVLKAISDAAGFEIANLGRFATAEGDFREAAFVIYVMLRPRLWRDLGTLARNSRRAIAALNHDLKGRLNDWTHGSKTETP